MLNPQDLNSLVSLAIVIALAVIALAAVALAIGLLRLVRDLRRLTRSAENMLRLMETELPPAVRDLRATGSNLDRVSRELEPRLERVDGLLDEAAATAASLRATVEAAEEIVRGPAAAVDRARRTVRAASDGLIRGADRLRRGVEDATGRRDQR